MQIPANPDFGGWATRNDLLCTDGRTIKKDAFKDCDGKQVPLVWNHQHNPPDNILGHAILQNRDDGVYAYCYFNDGDNAKIAKGLVMHGDVRSLSIYANRLKEFSKNVVHGDICEVSLVPAGANPGAFIDTVLAHGDNGEEDGLILGYDEAITLYHSVDDKKEEKMANEEKKEEKQDEKKDSGEETVGDIFNTLTEKQKTAVYALISQALEQNSDNDNKNNDEEDDKEMKHNVFENDQQATGGVLSHADQEGIIALAKSNQVGSFQAALDIYADENNLQHDAAAVSGFTSYPSGSTPAGVDALFPEWHDVRPGAPELVTDDLGWVQAVLRKVHKSPFSRIRTGQVDIRNIDALRAKGYEKGNEKALTGNYALARRTTDPQTIYVKSALNRDDIVDITDFDYVAYQYKIDRMMLEEELATAILIGDGRSDGADYKIEETHIRPVWTDDELFTIHKNLTPFMTEINGDFSDNFGENYKYSEAMVAAILDAMIDYRGTGSLDMFCTQQFFNKMLLARDLNGRRVYSNKSELATALGVNNIYPVSKFANKTRTEGSGASAKNYALDAIIVNLADYALGSTKGGEITHFTQFDIDFNQEKSLIETRVSGASTRIKSAIVIEEEITASSTGGQG